MSQKGFLKKISTTLKQPAESDFSERTALQSGLSIGIGVAAIIFLINVTFTEESISSVLIYSLIYCLVTVLVCFLGDSQLPKVFPGYFSEEKWTVSKELIHHVLAFVFIALGNIMVAYFGGWTEMGLADMGGIFLSTVLIGIGPVVIYGLWSHNKKLKTRLTEAESLQQSIQNKGATDEKPSAALMSLPSNQQKIEFSIDSLIYASSERNYINLVLDTDDRLTARNTFKTLEEKLEPFPHIIRCHRAYIVNTTKVASISGNAQGYKLSMKGTDEVIPVSRTYIPKIKSLLVG